MASLTRVERVARSGAVVLYLDGESVRRTSARAVKHAGLVEGMTLEHGELETRLAAAEMSCARARALDSLARVDSTRRRLSDKLRQTGYPEQVVEAVADSMSELGYLDDLRYARDKARRMAVAGGRGRAAIGARLRRDGVADESVAAVLDEFVPASEEGERVVTTARALARFGRVDAARMVRRLASRGFALNEVLAAVETVMGEGLQESPDDP